MKPRRTSAVDCTPLRLVVVSLDHHLAGACAQAAARLATELPGSSLSLHAAADWELQPEALARCLDEVARADLLFVSMLFMEDHVQAIRPALEARRAGCSGLLCCMSAPELVRLTRLGRLDMSAPQSALMSLLKRLRGKPSGASGGGTPGARQMAMLRRLPQILRFIPGTAQDLRAYFLGLQYFLSGSEDNLLNLARMLVERYAPAHGAAAGIRAEAPRQYPDVGLYHPRASQRILQDLAELPGSAAKAGSTVGVLVFRSYVLSGDTGHYDGVIAALEARGLRVIPAFAGGLDARPAIERFFLDGDGRPRIDALLSLTGFSLVGGPAYNDAQAAADLLARLDVPYVAAHPLEFQSIDQWAASDRGLMPVESTIMVAIPELDGAGVPMVYGGRASRTDGQPSRMAVHAERAARLAGRVAALAALRRGERASRRVGLVLFNFPPNSGALGTGQNLAVFQSLYNTLVRLAREGYSVDLPADVDALRTRLLVGNAGRHGTEANVHARIPAAEHVRRETWLSEIETHWGPAPGRDLSDGSHLLVLGERFGNVFVGFQPGMGYEGDPMRLLFERGFAPTHAFSAFYRWLREDFRADVVLHFGTHGALEFMPGKQSGLSAQCWPDRLIGELPNVYLYAANNPSEGAIARRRGSAVLVSYLTPPVARAGLYSGLADLKSSLERWRGLPPEDAARRADVAAVIREQALALDLTAFFADSLRGGDAPDLPEDERLVALWRHVLELEGTLIPEGLHVVGEVSGPAQRAELLVAIAEGRHGLALPAAVASRLVEGLDAEPACAGDDQLLAVARELAPVAAALARDHELDALVHALDGGFIRPVVGGDILRTPEILPTGRNLHGFDPFRLPSAYALHDGACQARRLIERHCAEGQPQPRSLALVMWGTDTLKTEGSPIGLALALMGARPRFDSYGRLCGATLVPLAELGRPRIDVVITLSGIFRDLLPLQTRLLAEAALLCARAEESPEDNPIRANVLADMARDGSDFETAALRVFSNADGAYGANVGSLVHGGRWEREDELADTFAARKCFAYGVNGRPQARPALLASVLSRVELAYQNLDSMELGVTTIDKYFDTLGGISRAAGKARGGALPVYIGDQTVGEGRVRTLSEQVALETRTRMLNPRWYEGILKHGYEGVRQIEEHVANTLGWSATTGQVGDWVYRRISETFVLDPEMRERLAALNPVASAKLANRLIEASERNYWTPDEWTLAALRDASDELEDRLEGVFEGVPHPVAA